MREDRRQEDEEVDAVGSCSDLKITTNIVEFPETFWFPEF
jgi:hypothetical protein